jgi:hypothetical protein
MDTTELDDLLEDLPFLADMFADVDLGIPDATPEEAALLARLLPPGYGQPRVMPNPTPAESSLTAYSQKISIRVNRSVMDYLRKEAFRRGVGYQVFMNMILNAAATGQNF